MSDVPTLVDERPAACPCCGRPTTARSSAEAAEQIVRYGYYESPDGHTYALTEPLRRMLGLLWQHPNVPIARERMHAHLYGDREDGGPEPKIFDVHMTRLRRMLPGIRIETVWGLGWMLRRQIADDRRVGPQT